MCLKNSNKYYKTETTETNKECKENYVKTRKIGHFNTISEQAISNLTKNYVVTEDLNKIINKVEVKNPPYQCRRRKRFRFDSWVRKIL